MSDAKSYMTFMLLAILGLIVVFPLISQAADNQKCDEPTIECIRKRNPQKIIAGVKFDAKLFGYGNTSQDVEGFDIELVKAFAHCWLGDEDAVEFVQVTSKDRIRMLKERNVDLVIATMTHTTEREKDIDFSNTYFKDGQKLLVREDSDLGRKIESDTPFERYRKYLEGKIGGAVQETTSIKTIEAKKGDVKVEIRPYRTYDDAVDALLAKELDFVTTDGGILEGFAQAHEEELKVVGAPFSDEPYGIGIYKGDSEFRDLINLTLKAFMEKGEYERIFHKWFPDWPLHQIEIFPGGYDSLPSECGWLLAQPDSTPTPTPTPQPYDEYVIQHGDTLGSIAKQFYDDGSYQSYMRIYDYADNKKIIGDDPGHIKAGDTIRIPQ